MKRRRESKLEAVWRIDLLMVDQQRCAEEADWDWREHD
jgi:hypothetical protein